MAHEKNDISDIVKKCKILLLDIEGTTTSISFVKDKLFPYAEENVKDFLNNEWDSDDVKDVVTALRKLALEDEEKKVEGVVTIPGEDSSKDDQIDGLVKSVKWQMSLDRKVGPLKQLQGLIWKKGYDKGDIKGHVYDDVSPALELWQSVEGQKVYIYSSGSVQAQKLLFGLSSAGDLLKFIDGHFDTAVGAKQESASYTAIAEKIGCKPEEILFLTDIDKEAEAARSAGVQAALVSREGNAPLAEAVAASFPVLYSFAELAATNKRKPDAQEQQPATKVLKTDVEADVKSSPEPEVKEAPAEPQNSVEAPTVKKSEEPEKMEVEEVAPTKEEIAEGKPTESAAKVVTIVEEVTETNEIADMPVCDIEPIIEENTEKTEQKETEKMETEVEDTTNSVSELKQNAELKNGDIVAPVPEETPPAVVTEIKDITNDKESLSEVAEVIEDLVPIVEEPPSQDMEELQNVGEVLDKECDEILSKVQDVTNLDNIPMKPLLNTIAEETMETENVDSNDIVEKILDSELELEMKQQQCADIDLNTVQEISDVTEVSEEVKGEKEEVPKTETAALAPEEKPMETEEIKVTNENIKESSHADEKVNNTAEEKDNSAAEKKDNSTAKEKINSTGEEKTNSTTEDKVNITAEDKASSTVEEKVNSNVDEKDSSSVAEKAKSNLDEKVISNAEDIVNSNAEDKPNTNAEEKVNSNPEEKQNRNDEEKQNSNDEEKQNSNTEQKVDESNSTEPKVEEKMEVNEEKTEVGQENKENKMETEISTPETDDSKPKVEVNKTEENIVTEVKIDADEKVEVETAATAVKEAPVETPTEESPMETEQSETPVETKENDKIDTTSASTQEPDSDTKETQVNGKTTNGDAGDAEMVNLNGDASKEDELTARLSMENGKEVNGANGEPNEAEKTKSENNGDEIKEVADIKVKTVAKDEPRNDPIEQPTEA